MLHAAGSSVRRNFGPGAGRQPSHLRAVGGWEMCFSFLPHVFQSVKWEP